MPFFGTALDAARVTGGTRLLDAGCDAELLALLASFRGAQLAALDAPPGLLAIGLQRLPGLGCGKVVWSSSPSLTQVSARWWR